MDAEIIHVTAIARNVLVSPPSPSSLWTIHHHGLVWLWNELWSGERSQCTAGGTQIRRDHRVPEDLFWRAFGGAADGKSTVGIACKLGGTVLVLVKTG